MAIVPLPERKTLHHQTPKWVRPEDEVFFVTVCCEERGVDLLTVPDTAQALIATVRYRQEKEVWFMRLFVVMPDHVHGIVSLPADGKSLADVVSEWKRFTARQFDVVWQSGFFEHRLRSPQSRNEKYLYVLNNPVRAGLVEHPDDWPYIWKA